MMPFLILELLGITNGVLGQRSGAGLALRGFIRVPYFRFSQGRTTQGQGWSHPNSSKLAFTPPFLFLWSADTLRNQEPVEELGRQDMGKLHRAGGDGGLREIPPFRGDPVLQPAPHAATKQRRESAQERWISGHTGSNKTCGFPATFSARDCRDTSFWIIENGLEIVLSGKSHRYVDDDGRAICRGGIFLLDEESSLYGDLFTDTATGDLSLLIYWGERGSLMRIIRFARVEE